VAELGRRILILGGSGAGKSTLARTLAQRQGLPLRNLDKLLWLPQWVLRDRVEADRDLEAAWREPAWVLDGVLKRHLGGAMAAADTVIFLDYPRWLCLARVLKRVWTTRGQVRADMAPDCPEQWDVEFLVWIWKWQRTHRPAYVQAVEARPGALVFKRPADLKNWLDGLR
jgi:adenylate kinase family enzyme